MNRCAAALSARFFGVTTATGERRTGRRIGNSFATCRARNTGATIIDLQAVRVTMTVAAIGHPVGRQSAIMRQATAGMVYSIVMKRTRRFGRALQRVFLVALFALLLAIGMRPAMAADSRFFDAEDGWLDLSNFLDTAYGFIPLVSPITEPAVGYGAVGSIVFIDRDVRGRGQDYARPNIAMVGGLATENGTRGLFGVHLGTWMNDRLRTLVGVTDMDVNLDFFGLGGDRRPGGAGLGYSVSARGAVAGANYRIGETPIWIGLRYTVAETSVGFDVPAAGLPGVSTEDFGLKLAGLTPSLTLDTRDNFFTPTKGWYVDLSAAVFREALGGDRNFEKPTLTAIGFHPLGRSLYFGVRAVVKGSSDGTPFYLRPYVSLRGVQALRYQGEKAAEAEAELRWQFSSRWSLVAFGGAGVARSDTLASGREKTVAAGGVGFRYLIARKHGLHMGLDVAAGPDKPIFYLVFGSQWLRP